MKGAGGEAMPITREQLQVGSDRIVPGITPRAAVLFIEEISVSAGSDEDHEPGFAAVIDFVSQQEIATDMTFAVAVPLSLEGMIGPFRARRAIIFYQEEHHLLQPVHVVSPRAR